MRRNALLFTVMVLTPLLAWAQAPTPAAPSQPRPQVDIPQQILDFGVVPKGEKIKATFDVHNKGTAPLEITAVRPTCGCTVASFDKEVPPGGVGKIHAEVDTTAFNGPITKAIIMFSNDPATPNANLVIKAEVRSWVEVLPRPLARFNVLQGEPATEKMTLVEADGGTFKVTGIDTGGGPYKVAYHELPEKERLPNQKGSQWEVTLTVPADAAEGMLNNKILVKTDSPKAPEVPISVTGIVRPIIQVIPGEIDFGTVPGDAPVGRNIILINNRQGTNLELTKVEVDSKDFTTEVIPLQAGQRYQVAVSMQPGIAKGSQKATLKISTNDPSRKFIEVPIQAVVQ
jgi:Protein of unknown function (DUF1573)